MWWLAAASPAQRRGAAGLHGGTTSRPRPAANAQSEPTFTSVSASPVASAAADPASAAVRSATASKPESAKTQP